MPSSPSSRQLSTGKPVVRDLARRHRVAADLRDGADVDVVAVEVGEEQRQALQPAVGIAGARDEQHDLRLQRLGGPDLAAVDAPAAVAVGLGARRDATGVGAGVGFGHAERDVEVAGRGAGEERLLQPVGAELHDRVEAEHGEVHGRTAVHRRATARDLVEHHRGVGDAAPAAAVLLGDRQPEPAALGQAGVEVPGELVLAVAAGPVVVVESGAQRRGSRPRSGPGRRRGARRWTSRWAVCHRGISGSEPRRCPVRRRYHAVDPIPAAESRP